MAFSTFQVPTAAELNALILYSVSDEQTDTPTTTSTTYVTIGTTCGIGFTAPTSGKVNISWYSELKNSGANISACTIYVKTGSTVNSGSNVLIASDSNPLARSDGTQLVTPAAWHIVSGLTPGAAYNVTLYFRVAAGTLTSGRRGVTVTDIY